MNKTYRSAECHPERKHRAKGLCGACYLRKYIADHPQWYAAQKQKQRPSCRQNNWHKWGLSLATVEAALAQYGMCFLCTVCPATDVDHDHVTRQFRAPLCHRCNLLVNKSVGPELLRKAADYIEHPPTWEVPNAAA